MSQPLIQKEALFNEVKGSLFEYLVARRLAQLAGREIEFLKTIDQNYLNVLSQQDRMVRQFYPEMLHFLSLVAEKSSQTLVDYLQEIPLAPRLRGKFVNSSLGSELFEADLLLESSRGQIPLSLKLNKKNSFVNTKSGGIKSFFEVYFPFIHQDIQTQFNGFVDREFTRTAFELHALNDWDYPGDYSLWVQSGKSELPGELSDEESKILKAFYARVAMEMHHILSLAQKEYPAPFSSSLSALMGFSSQDILQLICFHDFKTQGDSQVELHRFSDIAPLLESAQLKPFNQTASVEIKLGEIALQIRVKPMNKFTTTAIKINCSVKFRQS